ncbi:MAG: phosphatidylserine decarboxylase [Candidatus Binatia bacterium]
MKFAKEGRAVAGVAAVAALAIGAFFGLLAFAVAALLALGVLLFFRDPERELPADPSAVVSPADGRVVFAEADASPHRFAPGSTVKVAIFMSPLDVHVNRSPVDGELERVDHRPGSFGAAYRSDAGDINESNSLLLRTASGAEVVVVQIAGWLARRIICRVRPPALLSRGERFGLIMFGSRVDVYMPPTARLAVRSGETVRAGKTTLAWLDAAGASHESKAA